MSSMASRLKDAAIWGLPLLIWQGLFFIVPLVLLVTMSFWSVKNFRLSPEFTLKNWNRVFSESYFYSIYLRTLGYSLMAALLSSALAFPCSYTMAYKVSERTRRLVIFLLITPFFTSYLVRIYSWQVILSDNGLINSLLSLGSIHLRLLNTAVATMLGYLTLFFPLTILLQLAGLMRVDQDLIRAAHNLGAETAEDHRRGDHSFGQGRVDPGRDLCVHLRFRGFRQSSSARRRQGPDLEYSYH